MATRGGLHGLLGARQEAHHLRGLVVGGGIVAGLAEIAKEGNEYQRAINEGGAVTGASGQEMVQAAARARELGADLKIPGTSAAKAADAKLELAKAGQTSTSSIANARSAKQVAAADNLSAADASQYLGDVMDQFGLSSNNAGRPYPPSTPPGSPVPNSISSSPTAQVSRPLPGRWAKGRCSGVWNAQPCRSCRKRRAALPRIPAW